MKIGTIESKRPPEQAGKAKAHASVTAEKKTGVTDRLDVSGDVRRRLAEIADHARSTAGASSPERRSTVDQVRQRIVEGYYNQAEVRTLIADSIAEDLQS